MRSLDFIVFGVGRSGTTSLATALNLHRDILCGIERFHYNVAPVLIDFPRSFEDMSFKCNAHHAGPNLELLASKGASVAFAGNKNPRYYCNLEAWRMFKPDLRKIAIYRSPYEYLASWQQRAGNPDDGWHIDMQGVFGIYELFGLLRALLDHADDTLMVPYNAFYFDNDQTILDIVRHIGADVERYPHGEFLKTIHSASKPAKSRPKLPGDIVKMLEAANIETIDRVLLRNEAYRFGDVRAAVEAWLQSIPPQLGVLAEQWISARESDSLHKLMLYWARHFPQLDVMPNAAAVPATFKLYFNMLHTEGYSQWVAAMTMAKATNTSPLSNIINALSGNTKPPAVNPASRYLARLSRNTLRQALSAKTGT